MAVAVGIFFPRPLPTVFKNEDVKKIFCDGHLTDRGAHVRDHCGMSMSFHVGSKETILFDIWETRTLEGFIASVFIVGILAFGYEGLKFSRDCLYSKTRANKSNKPSLLNNYHIVQTIFHGGQVFFGNIVMLIFMTYNVWLCLSVVIGAMIGYFFFGLRRTSSSANDCGCH